jgi:hypothetical protein
VKWRAASAEDISKFYGTPKVPVSMIVLDDGGDLLGITGLARLPDGVFAVSCLTARAKASKRAIVLGMRHLQSMIEELGETVYARNDLDEPSANGFLSHCGFERLTDDIDALHVYRGARRAAVPPDPRAVRECPGVGDPA